MLATIIGWIWLAVGCAVIVAFAIYPGVGAKTRLGVAAFVAVVVLWPVSAWLFGFYYPKDVLDCPSDFILERLGVVAPSSGC